MEKYFYDETLETYNPSVNPYSSQIVKFKWLDKERFTDPKTINFPIWNDTPWHSKKGHVTGYIEDWYRMWKPHIPEGSIAIDIGCHNGDSCIPMLALGASRVIGFDPSRVIKVCEYNRELNPMWKDKWEIYPYAILEKTGSEQFLYGEPEMLNGGPKSVPSSSGRFECTLTGVNFQQFFEARESNFDEFMRKISFIKIDCEGYDVTILKSLKPLLLKYKPTLFIEWFSFATPEESIDLFKTIDDIGYLPHNPMSKERLTPTEYQHMYPNLRLEDILLLPKP